MARRRKFYRRRKRPKAEHAYTPKKKLLDMGRIESFKYRLKLALEGLPNQKERGALFANICAKSSNVGLDDAKEYAREQKREGFMDDATLGEVLRILDEFSTRR